MSGSSPTEPLRVPCPSCRALTPYAASNPHRPFCSARCRNVDLGAWANESYRLEAEAPETPDEPPPSH